MHIAEHFITDLRSLEAVIRIKRQSNQKSQIALKPQLYRQVVIELVLAKRLMWNLNSMVCFKVDGRKVYMYCSRE